MYSGRCLRCGEYMVTAAFLKKVKAKIKARCQIEAFLLLPADVHIRVSTVVGGRQYDLNHVVGRSFIDSVSESDLVAAVSEGFNDDLSLLHLV